MQRRTVRSDFGEVSIQHSGVVNARVFHGAEINLERAQIYHGLVEYLTKGESHCTVIELSGVSEITPDARKHIQEQSSKWGKTIAVALVTKTFTSKVLANFFLSVNRPSYPIKVFTSQLEAHHWAREMFERHQRAA